MLRLAVLENADCEGCEIAEKLLKEKGIEFEKVDGLEMGLKNFPTFFDGERIFEGMPVNQEVLLKWIAKK